MKEYLNYYLVKINFHNNEFKYNQISVVKIKNDHLQVISKSGKLGNKGQTTILYEKNEIKSDKFQEELYKCITLARQKIKDKKQEGYLLKADVEEKINKIKHCRCDMCKVEIEEELYKKISEWARGEGGWDKNIKSFTYKKVLCISCQIEKEIFKRILK